MFLLGRYGFVNAIIAMQLAVWLLFPATLLTGLFFGVFQHGFGWNCPTYMQSGASCFGLGRSTLIFLITSGRRFLGGESRTASARPQKTREMAIVGSHCFDRDSHHDCLADQRSPRFFVCWRLPGAVVEDPPLGGKP